MTHIEDYVKRLTQREELFTAKEIWLTFQVGKNVVYDALSIGELPSIRVGKSYRIHPKDLLEWIQNTLVE